MRISPLPFLALLWPSVALATPPSEGLAKGFELLVHAAPEQPREIQCNPGVDCLSPARTFFGGAIRGHLAAPEAWSLDGTLDITQLVDQDQRPDGGYTVASVRFDFELELGRTREKFGAALRVSPVFALGWSDAGAGFRTSVPGLALLLGQTDLWGEVGVPPLPTPSDPRLFHVACGFEFPRLSGLAGLGTMSTLGFSRDELDKAGAFPGAFAYLATPLTPAFDLTLRLVVSSPIIVGLGFRTAL